MKFRKALAQIAYKLAKRTIEGSRPGHDYVVKTVARAGFLRPGAANFRERLSQPPLDPIALDSIAIFLRDGKPEANA